MLAACAHPASAHGAVVAPSAANALAPPFNAVRLLTGWRATLAYLRQQSLVEGVWGGRKGWLAAGAVIWGARGLRKVFKHDEKLLLREVLGPGQQLIISEAIVRPTRRQRRRAGRTR